MKLLTTNHIDHYTIGLLSNIIKKYDVDVDLITNKDLNLPVKTYKIFNRRYIKDILRQLYTSYLGKKSDIYHANTSSEGSLFKNNLIVTEHAIPIPSLVEKNEVKIYERELKNLKILYDEGVPIITISNYTKKMLNEECDVKTNDVIYHGLLDMFRKSNKIMNNKPVILFNSRLVKIKEPMLFLEALNKIPKDMNFEAHILGEGSMKLLLQKFIKDNYLEKKVAFIQRVPFKSIHNLYNNSDILVHTCSMESFGMTVLEAMGMGLPVIVPSEGGACEVAEKSGILFRKNDSDDLCDKLLKIISDPELYSKKSEQSVNRATFFTWEKAADSYWSLYNKLI